MSYGRDLEEWLEANGVTSRDLAIESGLSEEAIRQLIRYPDRVPRKATRYALDEAKGQLLAKRVGADADTMALGALAEISARLDEMLQLLRELADEQQRSLASGRGRASSARPRPPKPPQ